MNDYTSQTKDNNFSINKHSLQAIFGIPGVEFYNSVIRDNLILLSARLKAKTAKCPSCEKRSKSVHSCLFHLKSIPVFQSKSIPF
jgi:hypothetical protein